MDGPDLCIFGTSPVVTKVFQIFWTQRIVIPNLPLIRLFVKKNSPFFGYCLSLIIREIFLLLNFSIAKAMV